MNVKEAVILFRYYQQSHHRKRTIDSYQTLLSIFEHILHCTDVYQKAWEETEP